MHLLTLSVAAICCLTFVDAHMSVGFPVPRASPKNKNSPFVDNECILAPLTAGPACGAKPFPCGYKRDNVITQTLRAGQVLEVEFFNTNFPNGPQPGDENRDQARHSGGLCEFSLSVDDGKSFHVIASYTKGCPDIFFKFPVKIPEDVPSSDAAIFAWTWINASGNREFYMNCADVKLIGVPGGTLRGPDITKANLPGVPGFERTLTPEGDVSPPSNTKGPGPTAEEIEKNSGGNGNGNNGDDNEEGDDNNNDDDNNDQAGPVVIPPGGNRISGILAQQLEARKSQNQVGQACSSGTVICLGADNYGFCDDGKIVLGESCTALELSCFNVPMVERNGVTVTCMSKNEFNLRLEAALSSDSGNGDDNADVPPAPEPPKPSPSASPVNEGGNGSFQRENGLLAQKLEASKDQNVAGQDCEEGSSAVCLGSSGVGLCGSGKLLATGPCASGLQCFNAPLVNKPGTVPTCMSAEEFERRLATALAS